MQFLFADLINTLPSLIRIVVARFGRKYVSTN